jgi:hypothetical protein
LFNRLIGDLFNCLIGDFILEAIPAIIPIFFACHSERRTCQRTGNRGNFLKQKRIFPSIGARAIILNCAPD